MNTKRKSKPTFSKGWLTGLVLGVTTALGVLAYAAVTIPHTFTSGTTISSTQVNENFQAIADNLSGADQNVTVTCGVDTIAAALANAAPAGRLIITVSGTCTEDIIIERDHVTLKDGTVAGTGAVQPVIQILGARGIVIDNMTVQGGANYGIEATRNADVTITNSTIQNNALHGVLLSWGAHGDINGSTIQGNARCGVLAQHGVTVLLTGNVITTAQPVVTVCSAIVPSRNTTVFLAGGNMITNTGGGFAFDIVQNSSVRAQGTVPDTITGDIEAIRLSVADFRNASISGNIRVIQGSWARVLDPSSVIGDIDIGRDSTVVFGGTPDVNGTVTCFSGVGLVDSTNGNVTVGLGGPQALAHQGLAEGSIAVGSFNNCAF